MSLKVMHVTTIDFNMGQLVFGQLKDLQARGYEVKGICSPGAHVAQVEAAGVPVITVPMTRRVTPIQDLRSLIRLVRVFRQERPDIVHTHTPKPNLIAQWAALLAGVPIRVSTVHGFLFAEDDPLLRKAMFIALERLSAIAPQVVFHYTDAAAATARRFGMAPRGKIRSLKRGMGTNTQRFAAGAAADPQLSDRATWNIPADAFVIGFVGRLVREKGLLELFEATATIRNKLPNLRLLIVGPTDPEKADALNPRAAADYGVSDICVFTGMQTDTLPMYKMMDLLVLPSYREGLGLVTVEAQAMSLPVVTTDIPGPRTAIENGVTGILVPVKDANAVAEAILRLAGDARLRQSMGEAGRQRAVNLFDERLTFAQTVQEYQRLQRRLKIRSSASR